MFLLNLKPVDWLRASCYGPDPKITEMKEREGVLKFLPSVLDQAFF